jgi:electron transport complex protein RnfD
MFLGEMGGCIGEVSAVCLLCGGIYLIWCKIISWHAPAAFIGVVALVTFFFPKGTSETLNFALGEVLSGGLFLGAIFMATDYATSPAHWKGKIVFAVGCGLVTCLIRFYGNMPEGTSFAILLMNLLAPLIERAFAPQPFGKERTPRAKAKA